MALARRAWGVDGAEEGGGGAALFYWIGGGADEGFELGDDGAACGAVLDGLEVGEGLLDLGALVPGEEVGQGHAAGEREGEGLALAGEDVGEEGLIERGQGGRGLGLGARG